MNKRKCISPACHVYFRPAPENRRYSGCCSQACADEYARSLPAPETRLALHPRSDWKPARRTYPRLHGRDNRKATGSHE